MNIPANSLNVGYKFSTHTVRDPYQSLNSVANWLDLVGKALDAMAKQKGKTKPFEVHLKDMNSTDARGPKTTSEKRGGKGTVIVEPAYVEKQEPFSEGRLVNLLDQWTKCSKHDQNCFVNERGDHMRLRKEDLSLWAVLVSRGLGDKNLTKPPDSVLEAMKKSPESRDHIAPPRGITFGSKKQANEEEDVEKIADFNEIDNPQLFPLISTWMKELDEGPRADDWCYAQFVSFIEADGYKRISELADSVTDEELRASCPGMSKAVAKNIIRYARADTNRIRNSFKKGVHF